MVTTPTFGHLTDETLALFTDRYEIRMMEGYLAADHTPEATFSLFFRTLPPNRGYVVAAGLEQVVAYLETLSFEERALSYLADLDVSDDLLEFLADFSFSGEVRAVPEGTVVFPNEPLLEVTAPIEEAQLFETVVINQIAYQSLIATKAARMRDVVDREGEDQSLVDFGSRRAHGTDAGMKAGRAAYLGGFDGTSNLAAGEAFDVPVYGTMAHSWVQSFPTEDESFEAFVEVVGDDAVLLVDTYDTVNGTKTAVTVAEEAGVDLDGVRLDSGDLAALSKEVAPIVGDTDVFISSGMDEYAIAEFFEDGGIGDGFGPGTALVTSTDAPKLEGVYKLVAVEENGEIVPSMKLSTGKVSYPGQKSVRRVESDDGFERDVLAARGEPGPGEEQLVTVFEDGERVHSLPDLDEIRARRAEQVAALPLGVRALRDPTEYPVAVSDGLAETTESLRADLEDRYLR
ncbi:Nicotinic acid phosphoribosyltransferase [Halanaeroarchaeum sp. HSR-CO]|uniref:nicotinate phosphoribosyltransferase n=1 Tax=Halanaeroarchaeum sp. HSR-CO TaxID=2866382 RepID=UPI00217D8BA4|nr:nicotinate phosphoribosyltransferase [Halanaeroarchaeum sp. HSR-CO]UWG46817.1 Nicotinic acid phosphoribosyltransferase [Halanaeroarchaeum sp. HSR-CO]